MRFALLGSEEAGVALARALIASGRHQLLYVTSSPRSHPWPVEVKLVADLEEVLADPAVEAVIIASRLGHRTESVRRGLQSERIVLCLHPIASRPESAYEAGMILQETRQLLLPLMPVAYHPAFIRLARMIGAQHSLPTPIATETSTAGSRTVNRATNVSTMVQVIERHHPDDVVEGRVGLGELRLLEIELHSASEVLIGTEVAGELPGVPFWEVMRAIGGEIAEVSALCPEEELGAGMPVIVSGRFAARGLLQMRLIPGQHASLFRLRAFMTNGEVEVLFPHGMPGPSFLSWRDRAGELHEEAWDVWDPWPEVVSVIEEAVERRVTKGKRAARVTWQDAIHCLELDDAARRSVQKRRTVHMEYPEATEEVSFKGTMTLVGCALLWVIILFAILSRWFPRLGWVVGPVLALFLGLQLLRWIIPSGEEKPMGDSSTESSSPEPKS